MSSVLEVIESYQTLLVGILGFLGVIATLFFNSKLSRDLKKEELRHERQSIRQALITELESLKGSFQIKSEKEETGDDWLVPKKIETCIYDVLLPKIPLLHQSEIKAVLQAYLLVRETPTRLSLLATASDMEGTPEGYFHIKNKFLDTARGIHSTFLGDIESAIASLENAINTEK